MAQDFFSAHSIDDEVNFIPMFRHQKERGIAAEERNGIVIAVRFTKVKVFYDILDEYYGVIFDNIDSSKVFKYEGILGEKLTPEPLSEEKD